ncbi:hypothetical protein HS125_10275 [bacterium]|nr:hypothetical protein [bacterium]
MGSRQFGRAVAFCGIMLLSPAMAQLGHRPGISTSTLEVKDLTGLSIKVPRVRIPHTTDRNLAGGSAYLQWRDPWLGYQLGKDLTQREFQLRDGVFGRAVSNFSGKLPDGRTPTIVANDQVSCGGCHNIPYRDAGGGVNFAKSGGLGRNTPHFFGGGLVEMIGWQVRLQLLAQMDANRDGWVSKAEMNGATLAVAPAPGAPPIVYGRNADEDGDGRPDLNAIFSVWYVDGEGKLLRAARSLSDASVAGFNFFTTIFGWGEPGGGLNPTNRAFYWNPIHAHTGMQANDPTSLADPENDGLTGVSNAGAQQVWTHKPMDYGLETNSVGISIDDPDRDGAICEITEGDLDMAEWYMLNAPRPGLGRQTAETARGQARLGDFGCLSCHVPNWRIQPRNHAPADYTQAYPGDRRFFDFDVVWNASTERMEGRLVRLHHYENGNEIPNYGGFLVTGIYSDFKHHDMGPEFQQVLYDGSVQKLWRTAPLWGVGSGLPWGHAGQDMTLDGVIRRHGGEAEASREAYVGASEADRRAVVAYLESLQLYMTDQVPADIDGDGEISEHFMVAGRDTGVERLNAEWLFATPLLIEGPAVGGDGSVVRSSAGTNIAEAYGQHLPYLRDRDEDGFPDVADEAPESRGFLDGVRNAPAFYYADLNGDGVVDALDLLVFREYYLTTP